AAIPCRVWPVTAPHSGRTGPPRFCPDPAELASYLIDEVQPVLQEVAPQLADPARAQAEPLTNVPGPPPGQQRVDHAPVALAARAAPNWEVDPKGRLVGHGRLGVVAQAFFQRVEQGLAVRVGVEVLVGAAGRAGEPLDAEPVPLL